MTKSMSLKVISRQAAKAAGLQFYVSSKPCRHGHATALRYVADGSCVACREEKMALATAAERAKKSAGQKARRRRANIAIEALARLGVKI
jgi:hypothetical protein